MAFYSFNTNSSIGSDYLSPYNPFGSGGFSKNGPVQQLLPQSLVLDSEKGELVKAPVKVGKKGVSEAKALAALKNHSDAERRRRARINAHLSTLRGLVSCNEKMDKAALLAEVIRQVKDLKKGAQESSKGLLIPVDADEVKVEPYDSGAGDGTISLRASICCEYRPELLSDLKEALDSLHLKMVKAEMATLGNRVQNVFVFTGCKEGKNDAEAYQVLASAVNQALSSVLDKASVTPEYSPRTALPTKRRLVASAVDVALSSVLDKASVSPEYSPRTTLPTKRRRASYFDTSSSSS